MQLHHHKAQLVTKDARSLYSNAVYICVFQDYQNFMQGRLMLKSTLQSGKYIMGYVGDMLLLIENKLLISIFEGRQNLALLK